MGCCACCMSEDAKIQAILKKIEVQRASKIEPGMSKFVVGRVVLTNQKLISPVSRTECAYYEFHCERLVRNVTKDNEGREQVSYDWQHFFSETNKVDFLLADPEGQPVYVPATTHGFKMYTVEDAGGHEDNKFYTTDPSDTNPYLKACLERHNAYGTEFFGTHFDRPQIRYREGKFSVNEVVAILGTASQSQINGTPVLTIAPVHQNAFSDEYFSKNEWSGTEQECWKSLTKDLCFLGTDDPQYMKVM